jgi:hypothetical protein
MIKTEELRHLRLGAYSDEKPGGIAIVQFKAFCSGNATEVLSHCKEVLEIILRESGETHRLPDVSWRTVLPQWFLESCTQERTPAEVEDWLRWWRSLSSEEQSRVEAEATWSLEDWLYWLEPNRRKWFWWDGIVKNPNMLRVLVEVEEWPFAWESLAWLLRASKATSIQAEE